MDKNINPAYLLRSYAWELLKRNDPDTWAEAEYGGMIPIVPLSEERDLQKHDGPHIVYGYSIDNGSGFSARKRGSIAFAVYDQNFRRLTKTMNILTTGFERQDESAQDVNWYTSTIAQYRGLRFGTIGLGFVDGGTPEETEGGRQSALITVMFEFYVDYDVITRFP